MLLHFQYLSKQFSCFQVGYSNTVFIPVCPEFVSHFTIMIFLKQYIFLFAQHDLINI